MKERVVMAVINFLAGRFLSCITSENVKKLADSMIDKLEDRIQEEPNAYDDVLLEIIKTIRVELNIPDNDG